MTITGGTNTSGRSGRRRAEIIDAASTLFAQLGYHRVGIDDVAAAVGITGGAIYKHVAGKQALLARAIEGALVPSEAAVHSAPDLATAITNVATLSTEHRNNGILLTREVRNLEGAEGVAAGQRINAIRVAIARLLRAERPDLPAPDLDGRFLGDAVLAVLCSPAYHNVALASERSVALLGTLAHRIATIELPPPPKRRAATGRPSNRATLVDRRDLLIDAAIELFGRRGYWAATMDDLGAAADIAGPSIYQHFASKSDLLVAVLTRGNEGLRLGLSRALAEGRDPADTLRRLGDSYVDFAIAYPEINRLLINESMYLPELERASVRGMQQRYVSEWVNLTRETHPELDEPTARFVTHAVLSVVNHRGPAEPGDGDRLGDVLLPVTRDLLLTQLTG